MVVLCGQRGFVSGERFGLQIHTPVDDGIYLHLIIIVDIFRGQSERRFFNVAMNCYITVAAILSRERATTVVLGPVEKK